MKLPMLLDTSARHPSMGASREETAMPANAFAWRQAFDAAWQSGKGEGSGLAPSDTSGVLARYGARGQMLRPLAQPFGLSPSGFGHVADEDDIPCRAPQTARADHFSVNPGPQKALAMTEAGNDPSLREPRQAGVGVHEVPTGPSSKALPVAGISKPMTTTSTTQEEGAASSRIRPGETPLTVPVPFHAETGPGEGEMVVEVDILTALAQDLAATEDHCASSACAAGAESSQAPLRVHAEWSKEGVRVWLGADAPTSLAGAAIVQQLRRWALDHGERLLSVVCNGRTVFPGAESRDGFDAESAAARVPESLVSFSSHEFPPKAL